MSKRNIDNKFIEFVQRIVRIELQNAGLQQGQWHIGTVTSIVSSKILQVKIDGSTVAQKVPCNPDITFAVNDPVFVLFVNGDSKNKYIPFKRAI